MGYTNAGKSSLLNALTSADVLVEDKLFATLDPTIRRIVLPSQQELLISDTVGFIRKLPHLLVDAFKATLEETVLADFLIEVVDVSAEQVEEHHRTTREVLCELGARHKPVVTVFNKVDLVTDSFALRRLRRQHPDAVFISALSGVGLQELRARLAEELDSALRPVQLLIPHDRYDLIALLHRTGTVRSEAHDECGVHVSATIPTSVLRSVSDFLQQKVVTC